MFSCALQDGFWEECDNCVHSIWQLEECVLWESYNL